MDYRKKFVVEPGKKVRLRKIDPAYTGKNESHEQALPKIQKHLERLTKPHDAELQLVRGADGGLGAVDQADGRRAGNHRDRLHQTTSLFASF
jgi:hypothetical protein